MTCFHLMQTNRKIPIWTGLGTTATPSLKMQMKPWIPTVTVLATTAMHSPTTQTKQLIPDGRGGDNGDAFPDSNETLDTDNDGVGDNGDAFPNDANETADSD